MSNFSNQVFASPGIEFKSAAEAKNEADIATLETDLDVAEQDILDNLDLININVTDITSNDGDIKVNTDQLAINTPQIVTNTTDIKTNTDQLVINTPQIVTNTTDIGTNVTNIGTNVTDIGTNVTDIKTNTDQLAINSPQIITNTGGISSNVITINNQGTDILALQNNYVVQVLAGSWTSGDETVTIDVQFARYLDMVTVRVDAVSGTNNAGAVPSYDYDTVVSITFRPSSTMHFNIIVVNNGTIEQGVFTIDSSGNLKIFRNINMTTDFGSGVVTGSQGFSRAYNIEA